MKKILDFLKTAFSKENYFRTCILILAAIITGCAVIATWNFCVNNRTLASERAAERERRRIEKKEREEKKRRKENKINWF